mgnify:CR=1 FL=1
MPNKTKGRNRLLTLADHAEAWTRERGRKVPRRNTNAYRQMYEKWATWAFSDLHP